MKQATITHCKEKTSAKKIQNNNKCLYFVFLVKVPPSLISH